MCGHSSLEPVSERGHMAFSLRLIAERLCGKGRRALVMNDRGVRIERVRLLPDAGKPLEAGALYICAEPPEGIAQDVGCAFAFAQMPPRGWRLPSLIVESELGVSALFNMVADVFDSLVGAIGSMGGMSSEENGLAAIVESLSDLVGNPVYIVDSSFKVMAITDDPDMEEMSVNWMNAAKRGYLSYDVIANLIRSDELHDIESSREATVVHSEYFYTPFANFNLRAEGKVQGHLFVVQMYKTITPCDLELINMVAPFVLRAMHADPTYQVRRGPLYEHFVVDWLEGGLNDPSYIQHQLEALSFDSSRLSVVAIMRLSISSDFRRERLARLLEDRQGGREVSHDDQVIALFQLKRHKEKEEVLHKVRSICKSQQCRAAMSDVQDSLLDTPRAYRQAQETLRICEAMGISEDVTCYGDVAAYQPYLNFSSIEELEAFCHPAVISLRDHDCTHAVKLLPTLSAFLKSDRDVQVTADKLYIHRNTLAYRLKRIVELCPIDLDDFNMRHRILESILIVENYEGITAHFDARLS